MFSHGRALSERQRANSARNIEEARRGEPLPHSRPRRLVLELTNACNLRCTICGRNDAAFTATSLSMRWFDRLETLFDDIEEVTLMGWGEPTLHPHFAEMLERIHAHGVRIYFCTNGMRLAALRDVIFATETDVIAVSIDGSTAERNAAIRHGADCARIRSGIAGIMEEKKRRGVPYPYCNTVTTLMADNLHDFPQIVRLAAEMGFDEAKAVYLTVFSERIRGQSLWGRQDAIAEVFARALEVGDECGIDVKLPAVPGSDPAGNACHQQCQVAWRDFFLGSDGYIRPCMSTPLKFFHIDEVEDVDAMWHHPKLAAFRQAVNDEYAMDPSCRLCYQSSHANWNRPSSFIRVGEAFAPEWSR